jgi:hypothetical protein
MIITPGQYSSVSPYELLAAAADGRIGIDQRLMHALLDDPSRALPDIVRFANEDRRSDREYVGEDLLAIFCLYPSADAIPFLLSEVSADPAEIPEPLTEALVRLGKPAVEPLLHLQKKLGKEGSELLFELACLGVKDARIEERINESPERDFLAPIYAEHSERPGDAEPFEFWSRYPEVDEPDLGQLPAKERMEFLDSPYEPHRVIAVDSWLHEEHPAGLRRKLLAMAKSDPSLEVRCVSWEALREDIGDDTVRDALTRCVKDEDATLEERISAAIGASYLHYDIPEIREVLEAGYEEPSHRAKAIEGMWRTLDPEFGEFIPANLDAGADPAVRAQAIVAAGMFRMADLMPRIVEIMDDLDFRGEALYAYAIGCPGNHDSAALRKIKKEIEQVCGGFGEGDEELVDRGLELRAQLAGTAEEPEAAQNQQVRQVKAGRNDPCPCGSGKKFKKCCGA